MKLNHIVFLDISSFQPVDPDAIHYFASLQFGSETKELSYVLTARDVAEHHKAEKKRNGADRTSRYHVGQSCRRYLNQADLIVQASKTYKTLFPEAKALILGNIINKYEPQMVLDGPERFCRKANAIVENYGVIKPVDSYQEWINLFEKE